MNNKLATLYQYLSRSGFVVEAYNLSKLAGGGDGVPPCERASNDACNFEDNSIWTGPLTLTDGRNPANTIDILEINFSQGVDDNGVWDLSNGEHAVLLMIIRLSASNDRFKPESQCSMEEAIRDQVERGMRGALANAALSPYIDAAGITVAKVSCLFPEDPIAVKQTLKISLPPAANPPSDSICICALKVPEEEFTMVLDIATPEGADTDPVASDQLENVGPARVGPPPAVDEGDAVRQPETVALTPPSRSRITDNHLNMDTVWGAFLDMKSYNMTYSEPATSPGRYEFQPYTSHVQSVNQQNIQYTVTRENFGGDGDLGGIGWFIKNKVGAINDNLSGNRTFKSIVIDHKEDIRRILEEELSSRLRGGESSTEIALMIDLITKKRLINIYVGNYIFELMLKTYSELPIFTTPHLSEREIRRRRREDSDLDAALKRLESGNSTSADSVHIKKTHNTSSEELNKLIQSWHDSAIRRGRFEGHNVGEAHTY